MDFNEEAAVLLDEARNAKREQHQARRRARAALSKLELLKSKCREYGIKLVVDGQILVDGIDSKGEQSHDRSSSIS